MSKRTKIIFGLLLGTIGVILVIKTIFFGWGGSKRVSSNQKSGLPMLGWIEALWSRDRGLQ